MDVPVRLLVTLLLAALALSAAASGMSPIVVRNGVFVERDTGKRFLPVGFNYIRLGGADKRRSRHDYHSTFNVGHCDPKAADAMFRHCAQNGFTVVRVFLDTTETEASAGGIVSTDPAAPLSRTYMENVVDFLKRARAHGIRVIFSWYWLPAHARYKATFADADQRLSADEKSLAEGVNAFYLHPGHIKARAQFMADFLEAIKSRDAALIPAVFAFELENETHFAGDRRPFSLRSGTVAFRGKSYDCSRESSLQDLADAAIVAAFDECAAAVRAVAPTVLVSANVFSFLAVGKERPGVWPLASADKRVPARPLALASASTADYIDLHLYVSYVEDNSIASCLEAHLNSLEFTALRAKCREGGKPIIMGEFGASAAIFGQEAKNVPHYMTEQVKLAIECGMQGFLYWTYDTDGQRDRWLSAVSGSGDILAALAKAAAGVRPSADGTLAFTAPFAPLAACPAIVRLSENLVADGGFESLADGARPEGFHTAFYGKDRSGTLDYRADSVAPFAGKRSLADGARPEGFHTAFYGKDRSGTLDYRADSVAPFAGKRSLVIVPNATKDRASLIAPSFAASAGESCEVSFRARSSRNGLVRWYIVSPWAFARAVDVMLSPEWKECRAVIHVTDVAPHGKAHFRIDVPPETSVWLDDLAVYRVSPAR